MMLWQQQTDKQMPHGVILHIVSIYQIGLGIQ
jgi:hypothetical protein